VRGGARWLLMQTDGEQSGRAMCRDGRRRRRRCRDGRGCLVIQHRSQRNATRARRADDSGGVAKRGDQCNCCGGCASPPYPAGAVAGGSHEPSQFTRRFIRSCISSEVRGFGKKTDKNVQTHGRIYCTFHSFIRPVIHLL